MNKHIARCLRVCRCLCLYWVTIYIYILNQQKQIAYMPKGNVSSCVFWYAPPHTAQCTLYTDHWRVWMCVWKRICNYEIHRMRVKMELWMIVSTIHVDFVFVWILFTITHTLSHTTQISEFWINVISEKRKMWQSTK